MTVEFTNEAFTTHKCNGKTFEQIMDECIRDGWEEGLFASFLMQWYTEESVMTVLPALWNSWGDKNR